MRLDKNHKTSIAVDTKYEEYSGLPYKIQTTETITPTDI